MNQSQERNNLPRAKIQTLSASMAGEHIRLRARVHTSRATGSKMVFFKFRQGIHSVQGVLVASPDKVSKLMVKWAAGLPDESIVLLEGVVQKAQEEIKSTTIKDVELSITQVR